MRIIVARVVWADADLSRTARDSVALAGSGDQREYSPRILKVAIGQNQGEPILFHFAP